MVKKLKVKRAKSLAQPLLKPESPPLMTQATIPFSKLINSMGREELVLFLYAGIMLNEINMLLKWLGFCRKEFENELEKRAQETQFFFCLITLAGKLNECWEFLEGQYFGNKLSAKYDKILDGEAIAAKKALNKYLKNKNIVNRVRKELAFHYSKDNVPTINNIVDEMVLNESSGNIFEVYLSRYQGYSLFYSNHELMTICLTKIVDKPDLEEAVNIFYQEVGEVAGNMITFLDHLLGALITNSPDWDIKEIEFPRGIKPEEAFLPYFFDIVPK